MKPRTKRGSLWLKAETWSRMENLRTKLAGPTGEKPSWNACVNWLLDRVKL